MNRETLTSKTGLTAIIALLGTAIGIYTGTVPMLIGIQTIVTGLLALFLRDGISTQTRATEKNNAILLRQTENLQATTRAEATRTRAKFDEKTSDITDRIGA